MKNRSNEDLKKDYRIYKFLLEFHTNLEEKLMDKEEFEDYVNAILEAMKQISNELKRRGDSVK